MNFEMPAKSRAGLIKPEELLMLIVKPKDDSTFKVIFLANALMQLLVKCH